MADFKLLGEATSVVASIGAMTQGIGFPLRSVEDASSPTRAYLQPADMVLGEAQTANAPMSDLGAGWQIVPLNTAGTLLNHVTFDLGAETFSFDSVNTALMMVSGSLAHNSDNGGRTTSLRLFNVTDGAQAGGTLPLGIGRNVTDTTITFSSLITVAPTEVGDVYRLELGGGDLVTTVTLSVLNVIFWGFAFEVP